MSQTTATPPTSTWTPPPPPAKTPGKRTWKTWQLAAAVVGGLVIGAAAGGSSSGDSAKLKDAQAQVAAADKRAADAVGVARTQVETEAAERTASLDQRSGELDARSAAIDERDVAVSAKEAAKKAATFEDGTYQVGTDIVAGTYHTDGGSGCYWEKSTGGDGINSIIGNDNVSGPVTLTIEPAVKFFKSSRCGTWSKR